MSEEGKARTSLLLSDVDAIAPEGPVAKWDVELTSTQLKEYIHVVGRDRSVFLFDVTDANMKVQVVRTDHDRAHGVRRPRLRRPRGTTVTIVVTDSAGDDIVGSSCDPLPSSRRSLSSPR